MIRNSNETFIHLHRPPPGFYSWPENYFVFAMPQMWDETYLSESYKQQIYITISNQFRIRKHFFPVLMSKPQFRISRFGQKVN